MPNKTRFEADTKSFLKLDKMLKELGATDIEIQRSMEVEAELAVARMKRGAPEDTGRLKGKLGPGEGDIGYQVVGNKHLEIYSYAIDQEDGEDYAPIQEGLVPSYRGRVTPYFWKQIDRFVRQLPNRMGEVITSIVRKYGYEVTGGAKTKRF